MYTFRLIGAMYMMIFWYAFYAHAYKTYQKILHMQNCRIRKSIARKHRFIYCNNYVSSIRSPSEKWKIFFHRNCILWVEAKLMSVFVFFGIALCVIRVCLYNFNSAGQAKYKAFCRNVFQKMEKKESKSSIAMFIYIYICSVLNAIYTRKMNTTNAQQQI